MDVFSKAAVNFIQSLFDIYIIGIRDEYHLRAIQAGHKTKQNKIRIENSRLGVVAHICNPT
jgi:hypothetical protein